ncbi:MAG: YicC family protein [Deltaproteobacteria bacterium]|nr:YicC family protein [Deltaproteobacteria bacterium]
MIKSMTGYGKSDALIEGRQMQVEIRTVNHRYLDLSLRLPGVLLPLEGEIKKKVSEKFSRGRVDVTIRIDRDSGLSNGAKYELNLPAIRNYQALLVQIKEELQLEDEITLPMIAAFKDAIVMSEQTGEADSIWPQLEGVLDAAIGSVLEMREKEGTALYEDLINRLDLMKTILEDIGARAPAIVREYQKRLTERVKELTESLEVDEMRLSQEVAIMAERSDITEEVVRFNSHINQFKELLQSAEAIGRKVDFLIQEMNREINTIGSKSGDAVISGYVIEIKSELGKLREQVQNIE